MRKLNRGQLRTWAIGQIKKQGGICPLCGGLISLTVMGSKSDYVVDHDHNTGEVRGILHRSCNAAEGKVAHAAGSWGAKSLDPEKVRVWLEQLLVYWKQPGLGVMYPGHLNEEERAEKARMKRRIADARRRAIKKQKGTA